MNKWAVVRSLLCCGALALVVALVRADVQWRSLAQRAEEYRAAKQFTHATELYQELAALRPLWALPHVRLGQVYLAQGEGDRAEHELTTALGLDSREDEALVGLGAVAFQRGEIDAAVERWLEAVAANRRNAEARYRLAQVYVARSEFELAREELERLLLYEPDHQGGHYYLGVLLASEDVTLAREHLVAATTGADRGVAKAATGMLLTLDDVSASRDDARAASLLGRAYLAVGMPSLAAVQLEKILAMDPGNYAARAYLGYALCGMGERERAWQILREVTRQAPKYALGHYFLGALHRSEGYLATALMDFQTALRLDPSNAAVYADIAETNQLMGRYLVAGEWYQAAVKVAPEDADFYLLLAQFYVDVLPRPEEGLAAAQQAVSLAPDDALAWDLLGWAHYLAGDPAAAKAALEKALDLDADLARTYYHLGVVRSQLGDEEGARWAYRRAMDLDSEGLYRQRAATELSGGQ
jgi:tetratricopeptide (TPR) repeat protein